MWLPQKICRDFRDVCGPWFFGLCRCGREDMPEKSMNRADCGLRLLLSNGNDGTYL